MFFRAEIVPSKISIRKIESAKYEDQAKSHIVWPNTNARPALIHNSNYTQYSYTNRNTPGIKYIGRIFQ